ncbi:hypothetical protein ABIE77_005872 [Sinorhizobium fredii]
MDIAVSRHRQAAQFFVALLVEQAEIDEGGIVGPDGKAGSVWRARNAERWDSGRRHEGASLFDFTVEISAAVHPL